MSSFQEYYPELREIAGYLLHNPELGYKEYKTSKKVLAEIAKISTNIKIEHYCKTGLKVMFDNHCPKTIGIIAELDSLYQPGHKDADPETGAAQACGHYTQVTTALALINELMKNDRLNEFGTNLAFIFTPAEEFVDLNWRKKHKLAGDFTYFGGKQEAIKLGVFDDIDYCVSVHAIGEDFERRTIEINCDLAGFNFQYFDFFGKASHAAFAPEEGVNAQSIATLFTTALAFKRQQLKNPNQIRFNPVMIGDNTESINVIPDHVSMGTDIRYFDVEYAQQLMKQFNQAAEGCSLALGGNFKSETQVGYLPLRSNRDMNALVKNVFLRNDKISELIENRGYTMAAGDIGDVSYLMPTIQIGYGGWNGTIHGSDFKLVDPVFVLDIFPEFIFNSILEISNNLNKIRTYRRTNQEYLEQLNKMGAEK
ncbi:amidohydrolase [Lactobacillus crispatus]|uniref:M20/M25/M40 family metallo-hydrolase n=1 Tax=Lactobacillus crispatus TaxID=47770 RepID=UPI0018E3122C|nr:M20/M25/M40 family metallo-hydrolase [Lactobacillus crispatus]MBI1721756.1 amidohydrolase [Lactobacillus crispatus]